MARLMNRDYSGQQATVPLFRGSSRFESLILSHHSRFTCECDKEDTTVRMAGLKKRDYAGLMNRDYAGLMNRDYSGQQATVPLFRGSSRFEDGMVKEARLCRIDEPRLFGSASDCSARRGSRRRVAPRGAHIQDSQGHKTVRVIRVSKQLCSGQQATGPPGGRR